MDTQITEITGSSNEALVDALARILVDSVDNGAAVSFMAPLSHDVAADFWRNDVLPEVTARRRALFAAERDGKVVGTVQLLTDMPPNQPHRCEIVKMIVHSHARRLGIGRQLMNRAIEHAAGIGKTLITLDTRTGDKAQPLYESVGFEVAGIVPDFAWDPDGRTRHATTYMYRRI